jgi:hypothetical protein
MTPITESDTLIHPEKFPPCNPRRLLFSCYELTEDAKMTAAIPKLTPDQVTEVSGLVAGYISAQRQKYAPRAVPYLHSRLWS